MDIGGGNTLGVFVDTGNKYGQNEGARYSDDGKEMLDPGTPAQIQNLLYRCMVVGHYVR